MSLISIIQNYSRSRGGDTVPPGTVLVKDLDNVTLSSAPLIIYNQELDYSGVANNSGEVITIWNADVANVHQISEGATPYSYNGSAEKVNAILNRVTTKGIQLYAFGDSLTNPGSAASPSSNSWINLLGAALGMVVNNQGASGNGVWRGLNNAYTNMPQTGNNSMLAILLGYNDMRADGASAKNVAMIINCLRGLIANAFLGTAVAASHSSVTKTGTYSATFVSSDVGGKANRIDSAERGVILQASGAELEYDFTGDNIVVGFIGVDGTVNVYGSFEVFVDDVSQGVYDSNEYATGVTLSTYNHQSVPGALVFRGFGTGTHTVRVVAQSDVNSTNVVVIDYFGTMKAEADCKPIIVGQICKMTETGYSTGTTTNGSDEAADTINFQIGNLIKTFFGYPVFLTATNDYYDPATTTPVDHIHPNNTGHAQIYAAFNSLIVGSSPDAIPGAEALSLSGASLVNDSGIWSTTGTGGTYGNTGLASKYLGASTNGRIAFQYLNNSITVQHILGFNTANAATGLAGMEAGVYVNSSNLIIKVDGGSATSTGVIAVSGEFISIYREGSVVKIQKSINGTDWVDVTTLTFSSSAALYPVVDFVGNATRKMYYPQGVNLIV